MKKYCLISTFYCKDCITPSKEESILRFNYDGNKEDFFINFSNEFDPWHYEKINNIFTKRKDLVYGKIILLKQFIEQNILGKYEYICHIDYSDTKFIRSFLEMMKNFESENLDFIISTEKNCWPYFDVVKTWVQYDIPNTEFEYVNSGAIIAKTEKFLFYLEKLSSLSLNSNINFWDDQGVWQFYNLTEEKINSDKSCKYFFSTAHLDNSYFEIKDNILTTKFGTQPYLIHDNSSFSLNLRNVIN